MNTSHRRGRSKRVSARRHGDESPGGAVPPVRLDLQDQARTGRILVDFFSVAFVVLVFCFCAASRGKAQGQEHKRHVPGLDKISGGSTNQAFSGIVQSLDMKRNILNVNTVQGGVTEIFPIKKGLKVETAEGSKTKLEDLKPGTNVLIYYSQKGDRRTVKQIVVLAAEKVAAKKATPHS